MRFRVKLFSILLQKELRSIGCSYKRHANINRFYFTHLKMLLGLFIRKILWSEETCSKYLWIQFLEAIFINNIKGSTVVYLELKSINKLKYFVLLSTYISLCSYLHKKIFKRNILWTIWSHYTAKRSPLSTLKMQTPFHTVISNIKIERDSSFIQTQKRLNRFQYSAAGTVSEGKHPKCSKTTH